MPKVIEEADSLYNGRVLDCSRIVYLIEVGHELIIEHDL